MSEVAVVAARPPISATSGRGLIAVLALYCLLAIGFFHQTAYSIVSIWSRSETFSHGFLILPICLWLVWRQRHALRGAVADPSPWVLVLTAGGVFAWLLAGLVDVQGIQHLALAVMLITGLWAILGSRLASRVAFPLGFVVMAVPMGGGLIQPLTDLTADTTEYLVRASGVPVFREGNFITLPTGRWSVVEACSGMRYLIASVTLGLVYAYLNYQSLWRRAAFVLAAAIMPIVANSLRAYFIVMIGHLSNMELAAGVDHLLYGWVFFGIVMLLLFWLGSFWAQPEPASRPFEPTAADSPGNQRRLLMVILVAAGILVSGPLVSLAMVRGDVERELPALELPDANSAWTLQTDGSPWGWEPRQPNADRALEAYYGLNGEGEMVGLFLRQYMHQQQGVELVNTSPPWRGGPANWFVFDHGRVDIDVSGDTVKVEEAIVVSSAHRLLVWSWYRVDDRYTANPYLAKLLEARQQVQQGSREGTRFFLATPLGELPAGTPPVQARSVLQTFLDDHLQSIESVLEDTGGHR